MKADLHCPKGFVGMYDASYFCLLFGLVYLFFSPSPTPKFVIYTRLWLMTVTAFQRAFASHLLSYPC
jgi:hypothetical protein